VDLHLASSDWMWDHGYVRGKLLPRQLLFIAARLVAVLEIILYAVGEMLESEFQLCWNRIKMSSYVWNPVRDCIHENKRGSICCIFWRMWTIGICRVVSRITPANVEHSDAEKWGCLRVHSSKVQLGATSLYETFLLSF